MQVGMQDYAGIQVVSRSERSPRGEVFRERSHRHSALSVRSLMNRSTNYVLLEQGNHLSEKVCGNEFYFPTHLPRCQGTADRQAIYSVHVDPIQVREVAK